MKRIGFALLLCACLLFATVTAGDASFEIIQRGSKGEAVVRIQERLLDLGYYFYKPTGSYQTVTQKSVTAYQAESGLSIDGTIGEETYRALFRSGAKRKPFEATVSLTYTAQGTILYHGIAKTWEAIREQLMEGELYQVTNAATGQTCSLRYAGGEYHAEFDVPTIRNAYDFKTVQTLTAWLGQTNSFYKCGVLLSVNGESVAASIQWNGAGHVCLYVTGSASHVFGLSDCEHDMIVARVTNG